MRKLRSQPARPTCRPLVLAIHWAVHGAVLACTAFAAAHAQERQVARAYEIPAGALSVALNRIGATAGILLSFDPALVRDKTTPGFQGTMTLRQALERVLAGSGLTARVAGTTVTVEPAKTPTSSQAPIKTLSAVRVEADIEETATGPVDGYDARRSATGTKTDTPILETPAAVLVIPREVIDDQKAVTLKDVYENVSGVQQAGNTLNAQTEVLPIIRGFESPTLMRNGLRATIAGAVDLVNVERVEVLKGPASILYGALEPGGIVNYVTKRPQAQSSHVFEQQVGSYEYWRTSVDSTGALDGDGALLYRLNLARTDSDSFRDSMSLERTAIAPSLLWLPADRTELLLDLSYVREEQPYDTGIPVFENGQPRTSRSAFFNDPDLEGRTNEDYYAGYQLSHAFDSTWSVRHQLQYHRAHNRNEALRPRGIQDDELRLRYQNEDRTDDELQFVLDGTAKFSTGRVDHSVLIGAEYIDQDTDFDRFRANVANVAISDEPAVSVERPANQTPREDLSKTRWTSLYLQDQMSLLDSGRLKLLVGGRFDDVVTKGSSAGVAAPEVDDRAFSGRFGLLYMLSDRHSAYASASESFRPQFAWALDVNGTPLDPETGRQYEVGLKSSMLDERLLATLALYEIEKKNVAVFDQALFNATGQQAYFPGVKQRSRGVELDLAGSLSDRLQLIASYSYTDTEVLENAGDPTQIGDPLGGVSPHAARLWLKYDFDEAGPLAGLGVGGGARYVGESTAQHDASIELASYAVADIGAWYQWNNIKASLNVKNLFDKHYIVRASFDAIAHPGAPRTAIGSVSIAF